MASKAHESGSRHHESRRSSTDSRYHERQPASKSSHSKHHDSQHSSRSDSSRHHVTQHSSRSNGSKHHESQHSSRSSASRYHESQHSSRLGGSKHYESQHSSRPDSSRHHESQYSSQHSSRAGGSRYHESQYSSMRHHQEGQYSSRHHENQNSSRLSSSKQHQNPQSSSLSRLPILPSSFRSYSSVLQGSQSSSSSIKKDTGIKKNQIVLPDRFHEHALTMMSAAREPYRCSGCKEQGFGRSYRCENKGCRYVLHEECANAVVHRKNHVSHSFFEGQEFWFLEKPLGYPRVCDACRMDVRGFVYHRKATKDVYDTGLDLHPCCLKLRDKISYKDSGATKTLTLQRDVPKKCVQCKRQKVGDDIKVKGWSYLTSDGDCFHVSCFKELFLEKIRDDYFSEKKIVVSKMQTNIVENNTKFVKVGGGSSNNSKGSSLAKIVVVKIAPVVLKLIFSAIFGDPVSFVLALVEALVTSFN
ncbi:uncharacterized protein LOC107486939 isoform X1 [Arachis duranensis]|uniref:Uncharacterized protein LOC107486939 isoform X1 n=1 Tax=Arachis duranensis TaxID=130453 RepID=A0A9C6WHQ0_ARADU|nr:uncharacterized protein LOC107486939 isoform X1 [Arachis duranensis]